MLIYLPLTLHLVSSPNEMTILNTTVRASGTTFNQTEGVIHAVSLKQVGGHSVTIVSDHPVNNTGLDDGALQLYVCCCLVGLVDGSTMDNV